MQNHLNSSREDEIRAATVGELKPLEGLIYLVDYDPRWPVIFSDEADRLMDVLGERALSVEHVGSTAVPGLTAKPIIDIALGVIDSADEPAYVPDMEAAGYILRIREPLWFEHRMFNGPASDINLHIFSAGCPEIARLLSFRDRLRENEVDRERYASAKQLLARREWKFVQDYADAKTTVVEEILARSSGS